MESHTPPLLSNIKQLSDRLTLSAQEFSQFYTWNKRAVESIVIFKEENRIIVSSHNKDVKDFVKQIKTADQIVYMDKEVGRVAAWLQEKAGDHVPLQGINTRVIGSSYNVDDLVSIPSLIENASATKVKLAASPTFT